MTQLRGSLTIDDNVSMSGGTTSSCKWRLSGSWRVTQSNVSSGMDLLFNNSGGADFAGHTVAPKIAGNTFQFAIRWSENSVGIYTGTITKGANNAAIINDGVTFDERNPASRVSWHASGAGQCE